MTGYRWWQMVWTGALASWLALAGHAQAADAAGKAVLPEPVDAAVPDGPSSDVGADEVLSDAQAAPHGEVDAASDAVADDGDPVSTLPTVSVTGEPPPQTWDRTFFPIPPPAPGTTLFPLLPPGTETEPAPPADRPLALVRVILGLIVLLVLAYLAGHPSIQRLEERLGISQVITAGFPFVLLGLLARRREVGILTDSVLTELGPLLILGLGFIGFMAGFRLEARRFEEISRAAFAVAGFLTATPFVLVLAATAGLLALTSGLPEDLSDPVFLRDALILGTAAVTTAHRVFRRSERTPGATSEGTSPLNLLGGVAIVEQIAGVLGLALVAAYFRPHPITESWQLPGTAWLFLTLGLGLAVAVLMYLLVRLSQSPAELLVVSLGAIAFAAGFAGNVRISPVVVCFVMGVLVGNAPGDFKEDLSRWLYRLERPLYFLFLLVVGALWRFAAWEGWALMVLFVLGRLLGKNVGARLCAWHPGLLFTPAERKALALSPPGPLALALVINAQLLYPGGSISLIVTAILGSAILMEIALQLMARSLPLPAPTSPPSEATH